MKKFGMCFSFPVIRDLAYIDVKELLAGTIGIGNRW